ncbi:hypothetical protein [Belliella baltica]|uniref:hypothetical protein n=1 Tax=Belliella baltica TaxID=232259 RepID=UPI001FDEE2D3|nr:hypothetical protein [Belliella baltica]
MRFICVLDTNVIYPIEIRDLLFWFAYYDMYTPKWSDHIFDEWKDVMRRKGIGEKALLAFKEMVLNRRKPSLDEYEVLNILRNRGLKQAADYLHSLL